MSFSMRSRNSIANDVSETLKMSLAWKDVTSYSRDKPRVKVGSPEAAKLGIK